MCRGNRGATVFAGQDDVDLWLKTLSEACKRSQLIVHAYCVMNTHYHLLLETPKGNLVEGMKWFQGTFTQRFNAMHGEWGHLFQGRYKAKVLDHDPTYFRTAAVYILLNPVDAGIVNLQVEDLDSHVWSSYPAQIGAPSKRPEWLKTRRLFSSLGIDSEGIAGRRAFAARLQELGLSLQLKNMDKVEMEEWKRMEKGWVHGCSDFRHAMIKLLEEGNGKKISAPIAEQRRDISETAATQALESGLKVFDLSASELSELKKQDERKLLLAGWLRAHFEVSAKWCAAQLHMGHVSIITRAWHFYESPGKGWKSKRLQLDAILKLQG
jgi:REP element-mobilizing transposase RayT